MRGGGERRVRSADRARQGGDRGWCGSYYSRERERERVAVVGGGSSTHAR